MSTADRRKPTPRRRTNASRQYARANWRPRARKRSRTPLIIAAAALIILVGGIGIGMQAAHEAPPDSNDAAAAGEQQAADANNTASEQQDATANNTADNASIVMTLLGSADTIVKLGEDYIESGCHAIDKKEGELTSQVQTQGSVDTSKAGDYTVTYTASNAKGATKSTTRTVHVKSDGAWNTKGISVLMYHYVYSDDFPAKSDDTNYLHADKLARQCAWLRDKDYYFPSYKELSAWIAGSHSLPKKSVVLTFDDGEEGFLKCGIPVLEKYQVPATSFIIGNRESAPKAIRKYASEYVSFQSHSFELHEGGASGKGRGGIIYDKSRKQIAADARKMADMLGGYEAFAYPYGDVADAAPAALKEAGVLCAFTIQYGQVHPGDDPMRLKRVRVFRESSLDAFKAQVKNGS